MITQSSLPAEYTPYQELDFCSNRILGGGHIFALGQNLPLLVGVGVAPKVWLQAVAVPGSKELVTVMVESKAAHPAVEAVVEGNSVVVYVKGTTVLKAVSHSNTHATVSEIDFRPLGLNIFGNASGLSLGGTLLSRNTLSNVGVAFGLGG